MSLDKKYCGTCGFFTEADRWELIDSINVETKLLGDQIGYVTTKVVSLCPICSMVSGVTVTTHHNPVLTSEDCKTMGDLGIRYFDDSVDGPSVYHTPPEMYRPPYLHLSTGDLSHLGGLQGGTMMERGRCALYSYASDEDF